MVFHLNRGRFGFLQEPSDPVVIDFLNHYWVFPWLRATNSSALINCLCVRNVEAKIAVLMFFSNVQHEPFLIQRCSNKFRINDTVIVICA